MKHCNKIRNNMGNLNQIQTQIIMVRGFTDEKILLQQKDFSEQLRKPISTINYNVLNLRKTGLLTKLNLLTPDGKILFLSLKDSINNTSKLRAHKIFGRFTLKKPLEEFDDLRSKYKRISKNPKHKGFRVELNNCVILFYTPFKIVFYLSDVYGDCIEELYAKIYDEHILPLKSSLEQIFNVHIDEYEIASITLNHLAFMRHPLAKLFEECNLRYASDRIEVDHSHGVPELETVHKKHAVEDMDKILEYERYIRGKF